MNLKAIFLTWRIGGDAYAAAWTPPLPAVRYLNDCLSAADSHLTRCAARKKCTGSLSSDNSALNLSSRPVVARKLGDRKSSVLRTRHVSLNLMHDSLWSLNFRLEAERRYDSHVILVSFEKTCNNSKNVKRHVFYILKKLKHV